MPIADTSAVHLQTSCRPLVVEEFGLTKRFFTVQESKVVVAVVADALIAAKRAGKPFMGAWIWQAAPIGKRRSAGIPCISSGISACIAWFRNLPPLAMASGSFQHLPARRHNITRSPNATGSVCFWLDCTGNAVVDYAHCTSLMCRVLKLTHAVCVSR